MIGQTIESRANELNQTRKVRLGHRLGIDAVVMVRYRHRHGHANRAKLRTGNLIAQKLTLFQRVYKRFLMISQIIYGEYGEYPSDQKSVHRRRRDKIRI